MNGLKGHEYSCVTPVNYRRVGDRFGKLHVRKLLTQVHTVHRDMLEPWASTGTGSETANGTAGTAV